MTWPHGCMYCEKVMKMSDIFYCQINLQIFTVVLRSVLISSLLRTLSSPSQSGNHFNSLTHSVLINRSYSKPSANERELNLNKVGQFLRTILSNIGWGRGYASPPLSTANLATFFVQKKTAASSASEQLRRWNQRACKGHRLYYQSDPPASPKPNLWKLTERLFSTHSGDDPRVSLEFSLCLAKKAFHVSVTQNVEKGSGFF
jgi:hypothetical protein